MVTDTVYRVVKRACIIRIERGEDGREAVASYSKLSAEQAEQLIQELIEEGYLE